MAATKAKTATEKRQEKGWPEPAPSQVWRDNDKREKTPREVVIRELKHSTKQVPFGGTTFIPITIALCQAIVDGHLVGRPTRIDTDRMVPGSTGYSYVRG